jgi:hypothetical protein
MYNILDGIHCSSVQRSRFNETFIFIAGYYIFLLPSMKLQFRVQNV